jgi:drug/metabolite transporter (DMT)-like permease
MVSGILAGLTWALETVFMGIALGMTPFLSSPQAITIAPFAATFLHDGFSALVLLVYNAIRGNLREFPKIFRNPELKWLVLASAIGGPIGMTGYVMAVGYMGASVGAVASAIYPAIGTVLAFVFLKEKVRWYQWIFLVFTLLGVYGLSYSPNMEISNFWLGLLGAFMCAFGWGTEAVILAKCLKDPVIKDSCALNLRQGVSALIYGSVILPVLGGWEFIPTLFSDSGFPVLPVICASALFASISYLLYYKAIAKLGASKAMALNITYTAWAMILTVILLRDTGVLNPLSILCTLVVVVCGILAACDLSKLFGKQK